MPPIHVLMVGVLVATTAVVALGEWFPVDNIGAAWPEEDAVSLLQLQLARSNASGATLQEGILRMEKVPAAGTMNATVATGTSVLSTAADNASTPKYSGSESAPQNSSSLADGSTVTSHVVSDRPDQDEQVVEMPPGELANISAVAFGIVPDGPNQRARVIEMPAGTSEYPTRSKVVLVLLSMLGCGLIGVDRCYMGYICCGICKGITLGGLGVWAAIDYIAILINALEKSSSINAVGFQANFPADEVDSAYSIALIFLILSLIACACRCCLSTCWVFGVAATATAAERAFKPAIR